jgi:hypothetical protein
LAGFALNERVWAGGTVPNREIMATALGVTTEEKRLLTHGEERVAAVATDFRDWRK